MILKEKDYTFLLVNGINKENYLTILDKDGLIVIDHALIEFKVFNELTKEIRFETLSLSGRAEAIIAETNILVKAFARIVKEKEDSKESKDEPEQAKPEQ